MKTRGRLSKCNGEYTIEKGYIPYQLLLWVVIQYALHCCIVYCLGHYTMARLFLSIVGLYNPIVCYSISLLVKHKTLYYTTGRTMALPACSNPSQPFPMYPPS